jgi:hypothetical protein
MSNIRKSLIATTCSLLLAGAAYASGDWLKGSTDQKLEKLAEIQPGLGTVMVEYSNRYTSMYYAAKGGNWGLAGYQFKEALEIQEVGETTRPGRAAALKAFEDAYMEPLEKAIKAKDYEKFKTAFEAGIKGCNGCHASQGFPYIKYELPRRSPAPLSNRP